MLSGAFKLAYPEICAAFGGIAESTIFVSMPKASVNEDNQTKAAQHDIRLSWKVPDIESVPVSRGMEIFPDKQLGVGICSFNLSHIF